MNKKLNKIIIALVAIVVVLIVLRKTGLLGESDGVKVTVETASNRTIIETVNASGKVYPEIEVKVSPDISGEIIELNVQEGDSVRKGQVLARIYADIYTSQRDQASAMVNQQLAGVQNMEAQLTGLDAARAQAKATYDRQKLLLDQKVISRSEFETAESAYLSSQANYNAAIQNIRSSQASVESARAGLERADKDLARTTLTAPMDGVVSLLAVKKGERVVGTAQMAGTEMMRIADMNAIEIQVDVSENDIPKVNIGDTAIVEVDAYNNRKFKGYVTQIKSNISTATATSLTADVTNYKVHIRMEKSSYSDLIDPARPGKFPFRPGMSASAAIQTNRTDGVLAVPINAVTTRQKGTGNIIKEAEVPPAGTTQETTPKPAGNDNDLEEVVFVVDAVTKKVHKKVVKTGVQDINYIQIVGGLEGTESVVTAPYSTLRVTLLDGMAVKVVTKEELFEKKN